MTNEAKPKDNKIKTFCKKNKNKIIVVSTVIGTAGLIVLGVKIVPKTSIKSDAVAETMHKVVDTVTEITEELPKTEPRYKVCFKAFKTGDWYTKTSTDFVRSAYSVAANNSYGREYKIIDTQTGEVLKHVLEDASMKSCNGYPNGNPWY